jgi:peroxiredoxin
MKTKLIFQNALAFMLLGVAGTADAQRADLGKAPSKEATEKVTQEAIDALKASGMLQRVPKVGDLFPAFELADPAGQKVTSAQLLGRGKAIVTFYRGGWCPLCTAQLRGFQKALPDIVKKGATLIAISPEKPQYTVTTKQKNELNFTVLSDVGYVFEKKIGVVYELPANLREVYKGFGVDLPAINGGSTWELPIAATFVVDAKGKVVYAFTDADYKVRAPMAEVMAALEL